MNIVNVMDSPDFGESIGTAIRGLTFVATTLDIPNVPSITEGNKKAKAVGLGAMNLHGFLAKNHIHYGSEDALDFTNMFFYLMRYYALRESNRIAQETKETFDLFETSEYADGTFFTKYTEKKWKPETDKGKELFEDIYIPTQEDWEVLKESVMEHGLYHQNLLATAPNGSIAYLQNSCSSLLPINSRIEERLEGITGSTYFPAPYLNNENWDYYTPSKDMDMRKVIDTYATAQQHIDQGMSLTLTIRTEIPDGMYEWKDNSENPTKLTTRDLNKLRIYAWQKGIKTLYYVRPHTDGDNPAEEGCVSCLV